MTIVDDIIAQLRRGECSVPKRHEAPCATCDAVDERVAWVRAMAARAAVADTQSRLPEPTGYVHRSGHSEHLRGVAVCDVVGGGRGPVGDAT